MAKGEAKSKIKIKLPRPAASDKPGSGGKKRSCAAADAAAAADGGGAAPSPAPLPPAPEVLQGLKAREQELVEEHRGIERQIYELESKYLSTSNPYGNAMKGYTGLTLETADRSKRGAIKADDRLFSNSSLTGQLPAVTGGAAGDKPAGKKGGGDKAAGGKSGEGTPAASA